MLNSVLGICIFQQSKFVDERGVGGRWVCDEWESEVVC